MAPDAKTRRHDCEVDRLSNLPTNLLDLILDCLPMHDAARTSILSKTWRNVWEMYPTLEFYQDFFSRVLSKTDAQLSDVSKAISNVLLVHKGPILYFSLFIHKDLPLSPDTDHWIKNISNNGVREFELDNNALVAYKIPSYLFSCSELTYLNLTNCMLNPPLGFGGYCNLTTVRLERVTINTDMSFGVQLTELVLKYCTGIEHLGCHFKHNNNLTVLNIIDSGEIDWGWFECTQKVENLVLMMKGVINSRNTVVKLDNMLSNMPEIQYLHFDGFMLKFLEPGAAILTRPIVTMKKLNTLTVYRVGFYDLGHIQYIIWLMRSSAKLQSLYVGMDGKVKSSDGVDLVASSNVMVSSVVQYLQSLNLIDMIFDQLHTVNIVRMVGSEAELQFIKFLLASSPLLRVIRLLNTVIHDPKEESRVSKELMSFPRASKAARIIWT